MDTAEISEPSSLDSFLQNKHVVLFFTKSADAALPVVSTSKLTSTHFSETKFGSIQGEALFAHLSSKVPLKCESGIAIYKNRVLLHQLEDKTLKFFEQCVKDLHTSSTLPPVSPTLSYSVDVYTMRGSVHTPLILPPSSKSFDEYVPLRGSTSTLNSYVSVEKVAPAPAPVHVAPCKQEVTQEDAACCIIM
ncbi:hypothetical protein GGH12_002756 [Coemansia sp. RSA 1822]|nr:hypothetical protein LPJ76_002209 [Coemansia sp. RSA 638]KAJ2563154.1 hypothetical protein GGH12_002756 [Coemansia sp. RSA 1822]